MTSREPVRLIIRAIILFALFMFFVPAILFIAAGTTNWPMAWAFVALLLVFTIGSRLIVWKRNPDMLEERARLTAGEGTKSWDRLLLPILGLFGVVTIIVAGLDHRNDWSSAVPQSIQILAAVVIACGYGLSSWAMVVNRFFSSVARIQHDRKQVVVKTGPYRIVRHPGYAGMLFSSLALPIMLDAIWAIVPALVTVIAVIARTLLEDRMLRDELEGYQSFTQETRYRLIPGVW